MRGRRNAKDAAGFTLMELIVVLCILGAASALVGVALTGSMEELRLKTLAKEISASMRHARSRAVSEKKTYSVVVDPGGLRYGLYVEVVPNGSGPESAGREASPWKEVLLRAFPEGVTVESEGNDRPLRIAFSPQGDSTGGTIQLRNRKHASYRITVDRLTGRVEARKH